MDGLLTPVSTTYTKPRIQEISAETPASATLSKISVLIERPEDALQALKSEPDYQTLISVLTYLCGSAAARGTFSISNPSPEAAQITQVLITEIAPNYWPLVKEGAASQEGTRAYKKASDAALFLTSLRSLAGINAILVRLRALIQEAKVDQEGPRRPDLELNVKILLEILCGLLGRNAPKVMHGEICALVQPASKTRLLAQEFISVLAGGRIISVAAEAQRLCQDSETQYWISDGQAYSRWLGQSIAYWASEASEEDLKTCAELFSRSMGLGYSSTHPVQVAIPVRVSLTVFLDMVATQLFETLVFEKGDVAAFANLLHAARSLDQRKTLLALLKYMTTKFFDKLDPRTPPDDPIIPAAAGLIDGVVRKDPTRVSHLISWLTSSSGAGVGDGIAVRRAVLAALSSDKEAMATILEKSMTQYGDELYIRHAPILQQEGKYIHGPLPDNRADYPISPCPGLTS